VCGAAARLPVPGTTAQAVTAPPDTAPAGAPATGPRRLAADPGGAAAARAVPAAVTVDERPAGAPAPEPPGPTTAIPARPSHVPGYEVLGELGRGGMGVVYRARETRLNRPCALKMILAGAHADPQAALRFRAEAEAVARLRHPNVVQIHHIGEADGLSFFELEYVDGGSLDKQLDGTPWLPRRAAELVEALARGIAEAHRLGIVHRDLKPGNVLLMADGTPKIGDFGLAKSLATDSGLTRSDSILGTPSYMAPEQAEGKSRQVGPQADIYALGAILYELLTGRPPFRGATVLATLEQVKTTEPVPPSRLVPRLPRDIETIALKCLQKDPGRRYDSAFALGEDLRRFRAGESILARRSGPAERAWRWSRRNPVVASLSAALVVLVLAVTVGASLAAFRFRDLARTAEDLARTAEASRYFSDIALAHREILADKPGRAERLLDGCPPQLRGWEWHYLKRQSHTALLTIPAHDDYVFSVAYSPDGKTLATASQDGTARIFDAATGRGLRTLRGHEPDLCWNVCYSPDGRLLASCGRDKTVRVWEVASGRLFQTLSGHPEFVRSVAFSPDGRLLASGCVGVVRLWDTQTWQEVRSLRGGWNASFGPDGRFIGLCGGPEVQLWETAALVKGTGDVAPILRRKYDAISMAFSPDSQAIAFRTSGSDVRILDVPGGRELIPPLRHESPVWSVAFSPDGRCLASSEKDIVKVWDTQHGRLLRTFRGHTNSTFSIAFAPDGRRLASASLDGTVKIWDVTGLTQPAAQEVRTLRGPEGPVLDVIHSRVGGYFATVHGFQPEYGSAPLQSPSRVDGVTVWEATTCRQVRTLPAPDPSAGPCHGAALDAPFARIAWARDDGTVEIREATSSRLLATLRGHTDFVWRVAFSPDGRLSASAGRDATVRIWEASTGRPIHVLPGVRDLIVDLQFSPDGRRLVMVGEDVGLLRPNEIRIWDPATGQSLATLGKSFDSLQIALDADGRRLAHSVGAEIFLLDLASERRLLHLRGHTDRVLRLAFSPDGRRLVSAAHDGTVMLWEPETGREILTLHHGPNERVNGVSFSSDGRQIVSVGESGAIKVWDASPLRVLSPAGE
jgi:WD40 repeat protein